MDTQIISGLMSAAATVFVYFAAAHGDWFKSRTSRRQRQKRLNSRLKLMSALSELHCGELINSTEHLNNYLTAGAGARFLPLRVPFAPNLRRLITNYEDSISDRLDEALIEFEISNTELERVMSRNGAGLYKELHPRGLDFGGMELDVESGLQTIKNRLERAEQVCNELIAALNADIVNVEVGRWAKGER